MTDDQSASLFSVEISGVSKTMVCAGDIVLWKLKEST
jgi:hypothetical protein